MTATARLYEPTDEDKRVVLANYRLARRMGQLPFEAIVRVVTESALTVAYAMVKGKPVDRAAARYQAACDYREIVWDRDARRSFWRVGRLGGAS